MIGTMFRSSNFIADKDKLRGSSKSSMTVLPE